MNATLTPAETRALFSEDGKTWQDGNPVTWVCDPIPDVSKIVIGTPFNAGDDPNTISDLPEIPEHFATLYPNLTHLHLWQIDNLTVLPELPTRLQCLDVRGCPKLHTLTNLPEKLDTLVLEQLPKGFRVLPLANDAHYDVLEDLSLRELPGLDEAGINKLLQRASRLRLLHIAGVPIREIRPFSHDLPWTESLVDIRLNDCQLLKRIPGAWPSKLRRLELRRSRAITGIPDLPREADCIDLAYTSSMRTLPRMPGTTIESTQQRRPRTLFLYETGVPLERDLYGESDTTNVADRFLADQQASSEGRRADCELKVILLGNGRCGKSSLARCWIHGPEAFRTNEPSTHGVRLWEKTVAFTPVDEVHADDVGDGTARLNVWDFAGQDLYHSTHRLFLQSRAIFIICHNDHPPGADPQTDAREQAAIEREGEDVHRPLHYWQDQVDSLGKIPGTEMSPPVLIVQTKADRGAAELTEGEIHFSAQSGDGLREIEDWIEQQVERLLGVWESRSLPVPAMRVKDELRPMIDANRKQYWDMDESGAVVKSPYPRISHTEFEELVRRHCSGDYAQKPSLLLDRFHRSGFVYHDDRYLPDDVILDQRWAVQGIYTFASRQSEFDLREKLFAANGQFTKQLISQSSWERAGYDDDAMDLFLSFMMSCGMCFELLRFDESASGRTVYAAPGFFPPRSWAVERFPELETEVDGCLEYEIESVSEADIRSIIGVIGGDWSRSMYAWRWGCRFVSATTGAVCFLDWARPDDSPEYSYPLTVRFLGADDRPFQAFVRRTVHRQILPAFNPLEHVIPDDFLTERDEREWQRLKILSSDTRNDDGAAAPGERIVPSRKRANGIQIAFSFAGSDDQHPRIGEIPSGVASGLNEILTAQKRGTVLSYDLTDDEERLQVFTQNLAKGDLILLFWSRKYWESEYCVPEMMLIYKEEPVGRLSSKRVLTYVIDGARLSRKGKLRATDWEKAWIERAVEREKQAAADARNDPRRLRTLLKRDRILHDWYEFVLSEHDFDEFIKAIQDYRIARPIRTPKTQSDSETTVNEIVSFVNDLLESADHIFDLAINRHKQGRTDDAVILLQHFYAMKPDITDDFDAFLQADHREIPRELLDAAIRFGRQTGGDS